ncbi:MAG: low-complexity tail membrane protein, partial [Cyanobacteria bacterium J06638_6]
MKPWRCDPYLWVHLAGLATVPLWIDLCLLGLAVGNPTLPELELGVIVAVGVLPVLVMQLWQPFYIFCLPGLVVRPEALEDSQRRLLSQFRCLRVRLGALLAPIPLVWALVKLYPLAFLARELTPFSDWSRLGGLAIAVLGFFLANLFLQVPLAVLQVLGTPDRRFQQALLYPTDQIAADFRLIGLPVGKILPAVAGSYPSASSAELSRDNPPES